MRILCLTPWFPQFPGDQSGNYILDSLGALADVGHDLRVIVSERFGVENRPGRASMLPSAIVNFVRHLSIPSNYFRSVSDWLYSASVSPVVKVAIREQKPDVIHIQSLGPITCIRSLGAEIGVPVVATLHGVNTAPRLNTPKRLALYGDILNRMARVVVVGAPLVEHFGKIIGRTDHFRIVRNGVRLPELAINADPGEITQPLRFISVSNLNEGKGIDLAIRALAQLERTGHKDWKFDVIGDGPRRTEWKQLADELQIGERVKFHGACSNDEVFSKLQASQIFLLPSYREAFGIAYLEAMAMGLFTVGVEGQGPEAFIKHQESGWLVKPRSVESIVEALLFVAERPVEARSMADCGRQTVLHDFTWRQHAEELTKVFEEVVACRQTS